MNFAATIRPQGQEVNGPKEVSMARRRYQKGSLLPKSGLPKNGLWVGRWREDVIQPDGTIERPPMGGLGHGSGLPDAEARAARLAGPFINHQQSNVQSTADSYVCRLCPALGCDRSFPAQAEHAKLNS